MSGITLPQRSLLQKPPAGARFNSNCALLRGLQAMYMFNEGGGLSLAEASGQRPAASFTYSSGAVWSAGLFGPSINVSSSIGYANAGNICDNLANASISFWFKTGSSFSNSCIVGKFGSGGFSSGQGWGAFQVSGQIVGIAQLSGGSTYRQLNTSASYNNSKWHHAVITISGYVPQKIYIDGMAVATSASGSGTVTTTTNSGNLQFGADNGTSDAWLGSLDVIGIWNRVLAADEVARLYIDPFYFVSPGGRNLFSKARIVKQPTTKTLSPLGIISQEVFGANAVGVITTSQSLMPLGITSLEAPGAPGIAENLLPGGILSQENAGGAATTTNNASNLFPAGIATLENEGTLTVNEGVSALGIAGNEGEGIPNLALNLASLGITTGELFGALKSAVANRTPITIPLRRRSRFTKPPLGACLNASHPLAQGLAGGWLFNEAGSTSVLELISNQSCSFNNSGSTPGWVGGQFGSAVHFPGGSSAGRITVPERPAYVNLGLNGPMSVAFWYNYDAAQLALAAGSTVMGKSDSTDGISGATHGWNVNSDNWHLVTGGTQSSGPQNIKLEFERSIYNKQGGIPAPTTPGVWHHIVITTVGGASTPTVNDYAVYLDGVLQQSIFFVAGTGDATTSDAGYNFAIGSHPNGSAPFAGVLDTVLLYNRVLSSAEAQLLYSDPFCFIKSNKKLIQSTHGTGSLSITPLGIVSAQQLGAMQMQTAQIIAPKGIATAENGGALHAAIANIQALYPGAIVTLESLGADTVIVAVPIGTPASRILSAAPQYRVFNLTIEDRTL